MPKAKEAPTIRCTVKAPRALPEYNIKFRPGVTYRVTPAVFAKIKDIAEKS